MRAVCVHTTSPNLNVAEQGHGNQKQRQSSHCDGPRNGNSAPFQKRPVALSFTMKHTNCPARYAWTPQECMRVFGLGADAEPLLQMAWETGKLGSVNPFSMVMVTAISCNCGETVPQPMMSRFGQNLHEIVTEQSDLSDEQVNEFCEKLFILAALQSPMLPQIATYDPAQALKIARETVPDLSPCAAFVTFDVGTTYKTLRDFLALQTIGL